MVLLNREGEVLTGRQLCGWNQAMVTGPIVGDESLALEADVVEKLLTGGVITATQHPGQGSPTVRVIRALDPKLGGFF